MQKIAETILAQVKDMVPGRFEMELATEQTHPHADWKAYHAVRLKAEALGFDHLGDIDVISLRHDPTMMKRPVLAVFVSADGVNVLGHYRLSLRWTFKGSLARFLGGRGDLFDVGTRFGGPEGVLLETTTAEAAAAWDTPPFILRETLRRGTALEDIVQRHRDRVRDHLTQHPDERPVVVHTLSAIAEINDGIERRKLEWRHRRGWVTRDELRRLGRLRDSTLDQLHEAIRNAADKRFEE